MKKKLLIAYLVILQATCWAAVVYALGDGSSNNPDTPEATGLANFQEEWHGNSLIFTAGAEYLQKKHLKADGNTCASGILDGTWYLVGMGYRIANQFEPYIRAGFTSFDIKWSENHNNIRLKGDYAFALAGGLKTLCYKQRLSTLSQFKVNVDGQVRWTNPDFKAEFNGNERSVSARDFWIFEGRAACNMGIEFSLRKLSPDEEDIIDWSIFPYVGLVFDNSLTTAKFSDGGTNYGYDKTTQEYFVNMSTGLDIVAPKYVQFNVEAEWFNDPSVSGGFNIKF